MSIARVECPMRTANRCGIPCVVEKGATVLGKAIRNGDPRVRTQEAARVLRTKAGDIGCPKSVISTVMRSLG